MPRWFRLLGAIPLAVVGLVSLAYTLPALIVAVEEWGLPGAEWGPLLSLIAWVVGWSYGGALLACAIAGARARAGVAQASLAAGGIAAVVVGLLLTRSTLPLGAVINVIAGGLAVVAALVGFTVARRRRR